MPGKLVGGREGGATGHQGLLHEAITHDGDNKETHKNR